MRQIDMLDWGIELPNKENVRLWVNHEYKEHEALLDRSDLDQLIWWLEDARIIMDQVGS